MTAVEISTVCGIYTLPTVSPRQRWFLIYSANSMHHAKLCFVYQHQLTKIIIIQFIINRYSTYVTIAFLSTFSL